MAFSRLIRFRTSQGKEFFGEPEVKNADDLQKLVKNKELFAVVLNGTSPFDLSGRTETRERVDQLLPVLLPKDVPIVKCVGLNYLKHSMLALQAPSFVMLTTLLVQEGGRTAPPYPSIFVKPSASVAGFNEDIPIPKIAQVKNQLDYEGELSIVIGKTGKDISKEDALEYVTGYMVSNDVTARTWQRDPAYAGGVPQWCFSKGFDKFAPLGPLLVSPSVVGDASRLHLQLWVNDELRQDTETSDLLFEVRDIVSFISQGTTLEKGTVIMTGTPSGVAMGMKSPLYLNDGDMVKVRISELGTMENKMAFE